MRRPHFIARQSACPSGILGRAIAAIMVRETAEANRSAIAALAIGPGDHVLDVGCGGGHSIELLSRLVPEGSVTGVDPSPLMVARARQRNYHAVTSQRAMIELASAEALPFVDCTFDAALSVHTVYFWKELALPFAELARVLRPGGRLALVFRSRANKALSANFPSDIYAKHSLDEVRFAMAAAGLAIVATTPDGPDGSPALISASKTS